VILFTPDDVTMHAPTLYAQFASLSPIISSVHTSPINPSLKTITRSVHNIDNDSRRRVQYTVLDNEILSCVEERPEIKASVFSPSRSIKVNLVVSKKKDIESTFFEVWESDALTQTVKLPVERIHGAVCTDDWFGSLSICEATRQVVYGAEVLKLKTKSFFSPPDDDDDDDDKNKNENKPLIGSTNVDGEGLSETFGERYTKTSKLSLFILDLNTKKVAAITNTPGFEKRFSNGGFSLGQAVISPSGGHVVYSAWKVGDRRLGSIYCYQRPVAIYCSPLGSQTDLFVSLSPENSLSRSPVFSRCGCHLAFLASSRGFETHNGAVKVCVIEFDQVEGARTDTARDLCPETLWVDKLPSNCFSPKASTLYFTGLYRSRVQIMSLSTHKRFNGEPTLLWNNGDDSRSILEITDNDITMTVSSPNSPTKIATVLYNDEDDTYSEEDGREYLTFPPMSTSSLVDTSVIDDDDLCDFSYDVFDVKENVQGILLLPQDNGSPATPPPLIVTPHGGPHSMSTTSFIGAYAYLVKSGYAVLHVNYRGSTGYTVESLNELPGNCGAVDVSDVFEATQAVLKRGVVDESRVGICGGSHGGFLAGHMVGQFPELFKVAALRNPVTNIATMVTATDIPDWCHVEALGFGKYDFDNFRSPNAEEISKMFACSPAAYVQNVIAPVLIALGDVDLRVPPSQGIEFYYTLKNKVKTKLLRYPDDCHAIDHPLSAGDHWVNIKNWFDEHL